MVGWRCHNLLFSHAGLGPPTRPVDVEALCHVRRAGRPQLSHLAAGEGGDSTDGPEPNMQMHTNTSASTQQQQTPHCEPGV